MRKEKTDDDRRQLAREMGETHIYDDAEIDFVDDGFWVDARVYVGYSQIDPEDE